VKPPKPKTPSVAEKLAAQLAAQSRARQLKKEAEEAAERAQILGSIKTMSPGGYSALVNDLFRRDDYLTYQLPPEPPSPADFWAERGQNERVAVQYRLRDFEMVDVQLVNEMAAAAGAMGATGSWMFTAGHFTDAAQAAAAQYNVTLVDGDLLADLVIEVTVKEWKEQQAPRKLARRLGGLFGGGSGENEAA
jgi:hypothetical protein